MTVSRRLALCVLALAVSGCATVPPPPQGTGNVAAYREQIDLTGKLSVRYQKDGEPQLLTVGFTWAQRPGQVDVGIASMLGQTLATISMTPQQATLTQANRAPEVAPDIDTLTARTLGWDLPVNGLRDWLQGYAVDAQGQRFVASPAHDSVFTRDGWRLRFVSWQDGQGSHPAPRRIDAERSATATTDELAIRIVIDPA